MCLNYGLASIFWALGYFCHNWFGASDFSGWRFIAVLDVQSVHPWLFMITAWLTAIVFSLINYSFVAAFGNVGKAVSILFLVMQVSRCGRLFPAGYFARIPI